MKPNIFCIKGIVFAFLTTFLLVESGWRLGIAAPVTAADQNSNTGDRYVAAAEGGPAVYVTCDPADISDDILNAVNTLKPLGGGTIYLPECDAQFLTTVGSTSATELPGGINIIGQGIGKTILRSDGSAFFDINHWGRNSTGFRISGISFYGVPSGTATNQGIVITNVVDFRIDHCYFERILYNVLVRSPEGYPQARGVVDHSSFVAKDLTTAYGVSDTRVWDLDMKLGTADATFIEDCTFEGMGHAAASFDGGRYVLRHSTIVDSASVDAHGPGFGCCMRGARASEIYENNFRRDVSQGWTAIGLRAGGGVIFNNTFRNYQHYLRFSIDTAGYNATGGVYPTLDQTHDMWVWNNTLIDVQYDPSQPGYQDDLSNPNRSIVSGIMLYQNNAGILIQKDRDFFLRAPSQAQDGFIYTPYTYPHPLTVELNLTGVPADQAIYLNWDVSVSLPVTSTWQISYIGPAGDQPSPITGIPGSRRAYTLTGLTNYEPYIVTLSTIGVTPPLSDTVQVMPTDIGVYLPLIQK